MRISRRGKIVFVLTLTVLLAAAAVAVGFGWIILNWQQEVRVFLGIIFFGAIVAGLILNTSYHLQPDSLRYEAELNGSGSQVRGDPGDLSTAVLNILDNAVKYSGNRVDISVRLEDR